MKNGYIKIQVEGKNVNNYLRWLIKNKTMMNEVNLINHNKLELIVCNNDYKKLCTYSKTYKVKIIKKYGILKTVDTMLNHKFILVSIIISILFIYCLSNIIFDIKIIHNDKEIIHKIKNELKKHKIEKYKFKKNYQYIEEVKTKILSDNKETIEWIEIIEEGTKYVVKLVERKQEQTDIGYEYQEIVASKDAIIQSIKTSAGEKVMEINEYVKKDEVIVSGILTKPNGEQIYKKAEAQILGEVWYKIDIDYPLAYYEEKLTGKSKNVLVINFLNYRIPILTYSKYKEFKTKTNNIIENQVLPISLSKEKQYEVKIEEEIYTLEQALSNAVELSKKKLLESNNKIKFIKKIQILNKQIVDTKIKVTIFIAATEDITKVIELNPEIKANENNLQT